jgi:ketosteroid isomerase-like protein
MSHPNADLVRKGFAAFATGDMAAMDALFSDDVVWTSAGNNMLAGRYEGKEAVFGTFGLFASEVESFNQDVHAVLADDDHAVALVNVTMTRGGKTVTLQQSIVFHVAGGKVTEAWISFQDQAAADAFWA